MSTNLEIEVKALINEKDYLLLIKNFQKQTYVQINFYIDLDKDKLNKHLGLRIRYKNDEYELTLKEDYLDGRLETNQIISSITFNAFKEKHIFPQGEVKSRLQSLNIDVAKLKIIGQLKTTRTDIKYNSSLISIDKNEYNNLIDYEVEVEDSSLKKAKEKIATFLKDNDIEFKENKISKLERFNSSLQ